MSAPDELPLRDLPAHVRELLGSPVVTALDAYFRARYRTAQAIVRLDEAGIAAALADEREHMSMYLALVVERLDSRAAHFLVDLAERLRQHDAQIDAIDLILGLRRPAPLDAQDHGHDETGRPS